MKQIRSWSHSSHSLGKLFAAMLLLTGILALAMPAKNNAAKTSAVSPNVPATCVPAPAGMTGWWKGEGDLTDTQDGHDGTPVNGGPTFTTGEVGQAMSFDGAPTTGQTVTVNNFPDPNAAYSFDAWVYWKGITNGSSHDAILVKTQDDGGDDSYSMFIYGPDQSLYCIVGDSQVSTAGGLVPLNQWFHVAQTYDGTTLKVFINGQLVASGAATRTPSSGVLAFGTRGGVQHFIHGLLDEIEIFDRALSDTEVADIFNAGSAGKCPCTSPPADMIHWWRADNTTADFAGSNDGTLQNGATFASGEVRQAFKLDGNSNSYVDVGDVDLPGTFAIDAWINPTSLTTAPMIVSNDDGNNGYSFFVRADGSLRLNLKNAGNVTNYTSAAGVVTAGVWQQVAVNHDASLTSGNRVTFYVNGEIASATSTSDDAAAPGFSTLTATIGLLAQTSTNAFDGEIDEVEMFSRALDQVEVAAIYQAGGAGKCRSCVSAPGGMIAWWPGNGNLNEVIGDHDGTSGGGGPTFSAGEVNQAMDFDGTSQSFSVANLPDPAAAFTFDSWLYWRGSNSDGDDVIVFRANPDSSASYFIQISESSGQLLVGIGGDQPGFSIVSTGAVIPANQWVHVALAFDGTNANVYLNGNSVSSFSAARNFNTSDVFFGAYGGGASSFLNGKLDEIEIFARSLGQTEIQKIVQAGHDGKCPCVTPPNNLIGWWPGDGNANDLQGNHNGTLQGDTTFSPGEVERAFSFDGNGDYVDLGDVDLPGTFTIDAWINPANLTADQAIISKYGAFPDQSYFVEVLSSGKLRAVVVTSSGDQTDYTTTNPVVAANAWSHVGVTYNGSASANQRFTFYINGSAVSATPDVDNGGTPANIQLAARIGILGVGVDGFDGLIDELEVFNRELNASEIADIYHAGGAGKCKSEPAPTPTPTVSPTTSPNEIDGDGTIAGRSGRNASFTMHLHDRSDSGDFSYSDPGNNLRFTAQKITSVTITGNQGHFTGAFVKAGKKKKGRNKPRYSFTVDVTDNGPGNLDTFSIQTSTGYSASGNLRSGNINIH